MPSLSIQRERQAREEVGITSFSPGAKWFLCIFFVAAVGGGTAWHLTAEFVDAPRAWPRTLDPTRLLPARGEVDTVASDSGWPSALKAVNDRMGDNIADYEADLEERSPLIRAVVPTVNAVVTDLFGGSTESVYPGRNGWWFYRPDIDYVTGPGFLTRTARDGERAWDPLPAIDELHRALAARDIELIVAPAPVKPSIHPERFSARFDDAPAAIQNPSYKGFLRRLDDAGIRHVDLGAVLWDARTRASVFLATDTHWSPAGVEAGAAALAEAIRRRDVAWQAPSTTYARVPVAVAGRGDTVAMLELTDEATETVTAQRVSTPDGLDWAPDTDAEILLLGDSFANIYASPTLGWGSGAGLAAQLSAELGRPVDALTINDNGSYATRAALASMIRRGRDRLAGKKVVVYEFACRELGFGDWKTGLRYEGL